MPRYYDSYDYDSYDHDYDARPSRRTRSSHRQQRRSPSVSSAASHSDYEREYTHRSPRSRDHRRPASPSRNHNYYPPQSSHRSPKNPRSRSLPPAQRKPTRTATLPIVGEVPIDTKLIRRATLAALKAGGAAALHQHTKPGPWNPLKGAKVATAALGAAVGEVAAEKGLFGRKDRERDYENYERGRDRGYERRRGYDEDDYYERDYRKKKNGKSDLAMEVVGALGGLLAERIANKAVGKK